MKNIMTPPETDPSPLDETVATLALGDPPNTSIPLTARTLCQNVLAVGMVGSGKTTSVIYPVLRDAIAYRAADAQRKIGMFVLDSKCDGTTERVEAWAERHGRADDMVVLRPGSLWGIDPVEEESQLSLLDVLSARFACLLREMGGDNAYWEQTASRGIEAALAYDLINHGRLDWTRTLQTLEQLLLRCGHDNGAAKSMIDDFMRQCDAARQHIDAHAVRILSSYASTLKNWVSLDAKTRGILQSCVGNALQPLLSSQMLDYYPIEGRRVFDVKRVVEEGKILVLKVNATADAAVAATLGRLVKASLYRALQQRSPQADSQERLVGLFFDEYPLVATANEPYFGDMLNLQTLREKRGFVVAGTQGYVSMRQAIGVGAWEALCINFGSMFFLKSNERDVEAHARGILGMKDARSSVRLDIESRDASGSGVVTASQSHRRVSVEGEEYIVAHGSLARLQAHEAFYITADGENSEAPVFILPVFEEYRGTQVAAAESTSPVDLAAATFRYLSRMKAETSAGDDFNSVNPTWSVGPSLPASCADANRAPLMPCGTWGALDLVTLDQIFRETMSAYTGTHRARPSNRRTAGLTFVHLALECHGWHDEVSAEIWSTLQSAKAGMLDFARKLRDGLNRKELKAASRKLYRVLGLRTELPGETTPAAKVAGRDHRQICRQITKVDLNKIPEEFFGEGSVGFFTALEYPSHRDILPELVHVCENDRLPIALFHPAGITEENALTVAAAMACFANSLTPSQAPAPGEIVACDDDL